MFNSFKSMNIDGLPAGGKTKLVRNFEGEGAHPTWWTQGYIQLEYNIVYLDWRSQFQRNLRTADLSSNSKLYNKSADFKLLYDKGMCEPTKSYKNRLWRWQLFYGTLLRFLTVWGFNLWNFSRHFEFQASRRQIRRTLEGLLGPL